MSDEMNDVDDRLWTTADVARFLSVSVRTVRDIPGLPRLSIPGLGRRGIVRFDPAAVKAWAAARKMGRAA